MQLYVSVAQSLDRNGAIGESSGSIVSYADNSRGINLTSTTITSLVFGGNGKLAEISGVGRNGANGPTVNFTLVAYTGGDRGFLPPSMAIAIYGPGINYLAVRAAATGAISIDQGGSDTSLPATQFSVNDFALQAVLCNGGGLRPLAP